MTPTDDEQRLNELWRLIRTEHNHKRRDALIAERDELNKRTWQAAVTADAETAKRKADWLNALAAEVADLKARVEALEADREEDA